MQLVASICSLAVLIVFPKTGKEGGYYFLSQKLLAQVFTDS
jgi:hypothetical protein